MSRSIFRSKTAVASRTRQSAKVKRNGSLLNLLTTLLALQSVLIVKGQYPAGNPTPGIVTSHPEGPLLHKAGFSHAKCRSDQIGNS